MQSLTYKNNIYKSKLRSRLTYAGRLDVILRGLDALEYGELARVVLANAILELNTGHTLGNCAGADQESASAAAKVQNSLVVHAVLHHLEPALVVHSRCVEPFLQW